MTYRGHVQQGVIVLDPPVVLAEGTAVRVEPLVEQPCGGEETRAARYQQLLQRLREWNTQDTADDARLGEVLQEELASYHGIVFRNDVELERILTRP